MSLEKELADLKKAVASEGLGVEEIGDIICLTLEIYEDDGCNITTNYKEIAKAIHDKIMEGKK